MKLRGHKRVELKARPRRNRRSQVAIRSSQYAVAVRKSQVTQVDAVANQMLTLRGNKCLDFVKVRRGLYTEVYNYFPSDSNMSETSYSTFQQVPASAELTHAGEPLPYGLRRIGA